MKAYRLTAGPVHLLRLTPGEDLIDTVERYAIDLGLTTAWFSYLGAVRAASLRYYDQEALVYRDFVLDEHLEILSGVGNITQLDGRPFVHTHAAFGDADGRAWGGHLNRGTTAFSIEVMIQELHGDPPVRLPDEGTGLATWGGTLPG